MQRAHASNASNVENDAVGEEEAMQTVRQAVMQYAASRVQGLAFPPTNYIYMQSSVLQVCKLGLEQKKREGRLERGRNASPESRMTTPV